MTGRRQLIAVVAVGVTALTGVGAADATGSEGASSRTERVQAARFDPAGAPATSCAVRYTVTSQGRGRFTADLALTGAPASSPWRLTWRYDAGRQLRGVSGAAWSQRGPVVTIRGGREDTRDAGRAIRLRLHGTYRSADPAGRVPPRRRRVPYLRLDRPGAGHDHRPTGDRHDDGDGPDRHVTDGDDADRRHAGGHAEHHRLVGHDPRDDRGRRSPGHRPDPVRADLLRRRHLLRRDRRGELHVRSRRRPHGGGDEQGRLRQLRRVRRVQVTGPRGAVTVRIVDQCPECQPGDIDLSAQAFARIADPVVGRLRITWQLLSPALGGPLAYRYKEGSSQWWCGIQVRNHRNPVRTMEALVNGSWQQLPRQDYNYFLSANGAGCGKALRVTDIYGNQVTEGPVAIAVGVVQPGSGQFGVPG